MKAIFVIISGPENLITCAFTTEEAAKKYCQECGRDYSYKRVMLFNKV